MSLEQGLHAALVADGTVNGLVAGRIYPEIMPQDVVYPAISYQRISTTRYQLLEGVDDFTQARLQVDCWCDSYAQVKTLALAVKSALDGVTGTLGAQAIQHCMLESMVDLSQVVGDKVHRRISMDFMIYLNE